MLQVVLFGLLFGCAILVTNGKDDFSAGLSKAGALFAIILQWFCKLVPIAFACMIAINIMNGSFAMLLDLYPVFLTILGVLVVCMAVIVTVTAAKTGFSVPKILKSIAKPMMIGFSTATAIAAFPAMKESLTKHYHVEDNYAAVSLSMGLTFFSPADTVGNLVTLMFFTYKAGVSISAGWIISALLLNYIFAIASPAVPGVSVAVIVMLFDVQGIPGEWSLIASLCVTLFDYVITSFRTGMLTMVCACKAVDLNACEKAEKISG